MPRIELAPDADPADYEFYKIVRHRPEIAKAWLGLDRVLFDSSSVLPNQLKEEARRALAQDVGCKFCASLGTPRPQHPDRRERIAVDLAEAMVAGVGQISDAQFEALKDEFNPEELVELLTFLCFKLGSNMLGALLGLAPANDDELNSYADFVAGGSPDDPPTTKTVGHRWRANPKPA